MTHEDQTAPGETKLAEFFQLLGPPPVLSSENVHAYQLMMAQLLDTFAPQDFMERLLIKEIADSTWEANRLTRHKTLLMERRFQDRLAHQEALRKGTANAPKEQASKPAASNNPAVRPEDVLAGLAEQVDAILLPAATEQAHARALEVGIGYHERLDKAVITALARRDKALHQLERHRDGIGQRLRQVSDAIIAENGGKGTKDGNGIKLEHQPLSMSSSEQRQ